MYDGPRVFFELLMWVGWIIVAIGAYFVVASLGQPQGLGRQLGFYLIGTGVGAAGFCMIGKMVAGIGEELVSIRQSIEKKAG